MQILRKLLANGDTLEVLDFLREALQGDAWKTQRDAVELLQGQWNRTKPTDEDCDIVRNRISTATQELLNTLEKEGFALPESLVQRAKILLKKTQKRWYGKWLNSPIKIGAAILGTVTVLGILFTQVGPFWGISSYKDIWKPDFVAAFPEDAFERDSVFVLVLNFEDVVHSRSSKLPMDCVGDEILRTINGLAHEKNLAVRAKYADTIASPEDSVGAQAIRQRHHADLVIFALAKEIQTDKCQGEFCFRHAIDSRITAQFSGQRKQNMPTVALPHAPKDYRPFGLTEASRGDLMLGNLKLLPFLGALLDTKLRLTDPTYERLGKLLHSQATGEKTDYWDAIVTYHNARNYDRVLTYADSLHRQNPSNDSVIWVKGLAFKEKGEYDSAISAYTKALFVKKKRITIVTVVGDTFSKAITTAL